MFYLKMGPETMTERSQKPKLLFFCPNIIISGIFVTDKKLNNTINKHIVIRSTELSNLTFIQTVIWYSLIRVHSKGIKHKQFQNEKWLCFSLVLSLQSSHSLVFICLVVLGKAYFSRRASQHLCLTWKCCHPGMAWDAITS